MATWAQIIDGRAVNPVTVNPAETFTAEWLESNAPFVSVPDGTLHGAVANQDGTFTNPAIEVPVKSWDAFDFKMRFTAQERKDIRAAGKVNADVEDFIDMLDTAAATQTRIHADNALVIAALTAMEGTIIASGRKAEILGE